MPKLKTKRSTFDLRDVKCELHECMFLCCSDKTKDYACPVRVRSLKEMQIEAVERTYDVPAYITHKKNPSYMLKVMKFVNAGQFTDLVVKVAGRSFKCHLSLLQCHSDYFMTLKGVDELQIPDGAMTANAFELLYDWINRECAKIERRHIVELYQAAKYLQVPKLVKALWLYFDNMELFAEDTAFELAREARTFKVTLLHDLMMTRVSKFFLCMVVTDEFLDFDETLFLGMICLNSISVNSEEEVVMIILRWLQHDWEKRQSCALRAFACVRFNLLPNWFLKGLASKERNEFVRKVFSLPEIEEKVVKTISSRVIVDRYLINKGFLPVCLALTEDEYREKSVQRQWIVDKGCSYHHKFGCPNWRHLTFDVFNEYLETIIAAKGQTWQTFEYKRTYVYPSCCPTGVKSKLTPIML